MTEAKKMKRDKITNHVAEVVVEKLAKGKSDESNRRTRATDFRMVNPTPYSVWPLLFIGTLVMPYLQLN